MGTAAYNRGTQVLRRSIDAEMRAPEFLLMDSLNAMPRDPRAATPFGRVHFVRGHGGVWAECPTTGFGYWYASLRKAVAAWCVDVIEFRDGIWVAVPRIGGAA